MSTELYVAIVSRINVRSTPEIGDNIVDVVLEDEQVEVEAEIREQSDDGWVWRRIIGGDVRWIAEINVDTDTRLLEKLAQPVPPPTPDPTPDPIPDPEDTQVYIVQPAVLNVRNMPSVNGQILRKLTAGDRVELVPDIQETGPLGWVWRKIANNNVEWVAEFNQNSGERLLQKVSGSARGRVQTDGSRFLLDGQPFRFIGANLREFAFYGTGLSHIEHTSTNDRLKQLQVMDNIGMTVVRFHAVHRDADLNSCINLTKRALDIIHNFGMLGIVVLNDGLGDSAFYVHKDQSFHQHGHPLGHLDKSYFNGSGYQRNYLPFVWKITTALREHPAIFAWELGNEYAIHPQPASVTDSANFLKFAQTVSSLIRNNDPNHLVTTGLVRVGHVAPSGQDIRQFARRLYNLPTIDFGTVHFYQDHNNPNAPFALEEENSLIDLDVLKGLGKPIIVEEFGATAGDKPAYTNMKLDQWFGQGAAGFMQWGFSGTGSDIGVGDNLRGMDNYSPRNKGHFQGLVNVYKNWVNQLR